MEKNQNLEKNMRKMQAKMEALEKEFRIKMSELNQRSRELDQRSRELDEIQLALETRENQSTAAQEETVEDTVDVPAVNFEKTKSSEQRASNDGETAEVRTVEKIAEVQRYSEEGAAQMVEVWLSRVQAKTIHGKGVRAIAVVQVR